MHDRNEKIADLLIRAGIAFSFIYAAVGGFIHPENWIGYFPTFLSDRIPEATLLVSWGLFEFVLALWILFGKKIVIPASIAAVSLLGVVAFNWVSRDIVFRDITIALVCLALAFKHHEPKVRRRRRMVE